MGLPLFSVVTVEASIQVTEAFVENITPKPEVASGSSWPSPGKVTAPVESARPLAASRMPTCAVTAPSRLLTCDSPITPPVELMLEKARLSAGATKSVTKLEDCDHWLCVP